MSIWTIEEKVTRQELQAAIDNEVTAKVKEFFDKKSKKYVTKCLLALISEGDVRFIDGNMYTINTAMGKFKDNFFKSVNAELSKVVQKECEALVYGEEFLDKIVERIHKKQL